LTKLAIVEIIVNYGTEKGVSKLYIENGVLMNFTRNIVPGICISFCVNIASRPHEFALSLSFLFNTLEEYVLQYLSQRK